VNDPVVWLILVLVAVAIVAAACVVLKSHQAFAALSPLTKFGLLLVCIVVLLCAGLVMFSGQHEAAVASPSRCTAAFGSC
jgi:hypothetical protein